MNIYFTAETFFGRNPSFSQARSQFSSIEEQDKFLVEQWNSVIKQGDTVYHLGNFAWDPISAEAIAPMLNGKIILLPGMYDAHLYESVVFQQTGNDLSTNYYGGIRLKDQETHLIFSHWPMLDWPRKEHGSIHVHGGDLRNENLSKEKRICVRCDNWSFLPVNIDTIVDICQTSVEI